MAMHCRRVALKAVSSCLSSYSSISACIMTVGFCNCIPKRTFVGDHHLRMGLYEERRFQCLDKLKEVNVSRKMYVGMLEQQIADQKNIISLEDVVKLMLIANSNKHEDLALSMLRRIVMQHKSGIGSHTLKKRLLGPLTMRMFYYLCQPDKALAAFRDPQLTGIFKDISTGVVLLDLLFETAHYQEILEIFDELQNYSAAAVVLLAAACYRLGTMEAFEKLRTAIYLTSKSGRQLGQRELNLAAYLAIKLKQYDFVSECEQLSPRISNSANTISLRIFKALEQSADEELISLLELVQQRFLESARILPSDVVQRIGERIAQLTAKRNEASSSVLPRLEHLYKGLTLAGRFTAATLEERLLKPMKTVISVHSVSHSLETADQSASPKSDDSTQNQSVYRRARPVWSANSIQRSSSSSSSRPYLGTTGKPAVKLSQWSRDSSVQAVATRSNYNTRQSTGTLPPQIVKTLEHADETELTAVLNHVRRKLQSRRTASRETVTNQIAELLSTLNSQVIQIRPVKSVNIDCLQAAYKALYDVKKLLEVSAHSKTDDHTDQTAT